MAHHTELNPAAHFTVGAVGPPGERTFFLQGRRGSQTITLVIEKEQANMLANSFESLLGELDKKHPHKSRQSSDPTWRDMRLLEPVEAYFRVGNMGLGYNEESDQIVLVAYELVDDEEEEPRVVSFWANREQVQALIKHIKDVVKAGRPICGNCGGPIDADGHFCPQRNGHSH